MTMASDGRTSVLAKLTADIMTEKRTAARALTPVEGEAKPPAAEPRGPLDGKHDTSFPYDDPQTIVQALAVARQHIGAIRTELDHVEGGVKALEVLYGGGRDDTTKVSQADIRKDKEREADERIKAQADFNADFEAKQKAAQEAVFTEPSGAAVALAEDMGEDISETTQGWTCPTHGKAITKVSAKSGTEFRGCPDCNQFER